MNYDRMLSRAVALPSRIPPEKDIPSILGYCGTLAEDTFGAHTTLLPWRVVVRREPEYPETIAYSTHIDIALCEGRSWVGYFYEASHESVHALDATEATRGEATRLEEGVAYAFSLYVVGLVFGPAQVRNLADGGDYEKARSRISKIDSDVLRLGRKVRARAGSFRKVSANDILAIYPDTPESLLSELLRKFEY
ncbi:MAG: hypothetical protein F4Y49_09800 [Dehalococcoidia bacterium]|nr:hypothetical protein [Dehalococcoidia bacterium]